MYLIIDRIHGLLISQMLFPPSYSVDNQPKKDNRVKLQRLKDLQTVGPNGSAPS
jgi:hypothetical protein